MNTNNVRQQISESQYHPGLEVDEIPHHSSPTIPSDATPQVSASAIQFPETAIVGSLGDAARELTQGTEVPAEFVYGALLTMFGLAASGDLLLNVGMKHDTRLFTVLVGESGDAKKSSALGIAKEFFDSVIEINMPFVLQGAGSAEGLTTALETNPRTLLMYDEVRAFLDKTKIQGSVLLPMVTKLYEHDTYENFTKGRQVSVHGVKLGFIGCATTGTYENMWTQEAIDIGFTNRLFIVGASRRPKVLFPAKRDEAKLGWIRSRIREQLKRLPVTFEFTPEAQAELEAWYTAQPTEDHARRLDTIARSLLPLIALITDKERIDLETAKIVRSIVEYEFHIRRLLDPIDAEGTVAKLEEMIRRVLKTKNPLKKTDLKRSCNYSRFGIYQFDKALKNLIGAGEVRESGGKFFLVD